jgi:hypothetical protein
VDGGDSGVGGTIDMTHETSGCSSAPVAATSGWLLLLALTSLLAVLRKITT